jgi:hypothetical protein
MEIDTVCSYGKYEVVIIFTKPINDEMKSNILKHFGTWDGDDVKAVDDIINERKDFSAGRIEISSTNTSYELNSPFENIVGATSNVTIDDILEAIHDRKEL